MGKPKDNATRQRIIQAACELFVKHGLHGVNMRELAERADVNKGLLHYYFKTKQSIFREVFVEQMTLLYQEVGGVLEQQGPLSNKIPALVDGYFHMLERVPGLPAFVLFEMQKDPGIIADSSARDILFRVMSAVEPELRALGLPPERASGLQFVMDVIALCAFTFGTLPGIAKAMKMNKAQRAAYLEARKAHIIAVIRQNLEP